MSCIYFHSPSETVEISGTERAHMALIIGHLSGTRLFMESGDFAADLNKAMVANPAVRLIARLHGQCEIHCYVEGQDRAWLADRIFEALHTLVRVKDMDGDRMVELLRVGFSASGGRIGWLRLMDWLRSRSDEPVVCSYSVTSQFPPYNAETETHASWEQALAGLRARGEWLRMNPTTWDTYSFATS